MLIKKSKNRQEWNIWLDIIKINEGVINHSSHWPSHKPHNQS